MSRTALTFSTLLLIVLLFPAGQHALTFAQENIPQSPIGCAFDSYGNLRSCDHSARLDNFAIQIQNTPEGYGYVIVYAPESSAKQITHRILDYLVNTRGIAPKQIKTVHAGYNDPITEPWIQLWIVPKGAKPPKPTKRDVNLATLKGMLGEYEDSDDIVLGQPEGWIEEPHIDGPLVGNVTYDAFEDVLKAQKNSVAHIVGFNGAEAVPGAWRRVAEETVEELKQYGLEASRFKIGYGGQARETKVQFWILPKGETPPLKDPATEPAPPKAVQVGEFDDSTLGTDKNEVAVFDRLLKVMRDNSDLRACLVVRMRVPVPEDETESDPEAADLPKLVEKWKSELATKHKLRPDRVVVLFANALESRLSSVEVWVVPPGQPLPELDQ